MKENKYLGWLRMKGDTTTHRIASFFFFLVNVLHYYLNGKVQGQYKLLYIKLYTSS